MDNSVNAEAINEFLLDIVETDEYKNVEYLVFAIRKLYLHFMANSRVKQFEMPAYLESLVNIVVE